MHCGRLVYHFTSRWNGRRGEHFLLEEQLPDFNDIHFSRVNFAYRSRIRGVFTAFRWKGNEVTTVIVEKITSKWLTDWTHFDQKLYRSLGISLTKPPWSCYSGYVGAPTENDRFLKTEV